MEITQFTYFQQAGGQTLDPVSVEITYGMERILMALQGVAHFKDIAYAPGITYGEAFGQAEYEMSRYYLDDADVDDQPRAVRGVRGRGPPHARRASCRCRRTSYVLKCSHAFNVLDARGAICTTERAAAFAPMRGLARDVAELWIARRAELGHPLGIAGRAGRRPSARRWPRCPAARRRWCSRSASRRLPPPSVGHTAARRDRAHRSAGRDAAGARRRSP